MGGMGFIPERLSIISIININLIMMIIIIPSVKTGQQIYIMIITGIIIMMALIVAYIR